MIRDKQSCIQLLVAGRRATTLRVKTRAIRKYVVWLASAFSVPFPSEASHVIEYLQVKLTEPSNRGSIKGAHQEMCFEEEICGVAESERCTNSPVYLLAKKEALASALPGALPRQAPRFPTTPLAAVEDLVLDETSPACFRIFGWWLLVQSWGTLRFSDHRGIIPTHVELDEQGFTAELTHSKTLGSDRGVNVRLVVVRRVCAIKRDGWMPTGW